MGFTLSDPDFITTRGPLIRILSPSGGAFQIGDRVRYSMGQEFNEHYPTDGSPRTFSTVCIVKAEDKQNFLGAILPDVYEDTANQSTTQQLVMTAFGQSPVIRYWRNPLVRLSPERHPIRSRAYVVDAVVVSGAGYVAKNPSNIPSYADNAGQIIPEEILPGWPTYRTAGVAIDPETDKIVPTVGEGYIRVAVTWKDLPYEVNVGGRTDSGITADAASDAFANNATRSEIVRYCVFKPQPKGQNAGIAGGELYYVKDDGTLLLKPNGQPALAPLESQTFYNPLINFSIIWKMVPRVPFAAFAMQGFCNEKQNIPFPETILKDKPDAGTIRYVAPEISDPYYTVSDGQVFDITYNITYRPGGNTTPNRGWNSTWCGIVRDIRRVVFGILEGGVIKTAKAVDGGVPIQLPVTTADGSNQDARRTTKSACIAPFGELQNLFRFEGAPLTPTSS